MYTKLADSILTSTIWMEDDQTRIVWLTLMAMKDKNGEVQASVPGLANVARVSVDACRLAIDKFLSPDLDSRTKDDEGRRLEVIDGGWFLINHEKYRDLASDDDRKRKSAIRQQRARDKAKRNNPRDSHAESRQISHTDTDTDTDTDKKTKKTQPAADERFEFFWLAYPKRTAKGNARAAWQKAVKKIDAGIIIKAATRYATSVTGSEPKYIAHPATWLNAERWDDEPESPAKKEILPGTPEWAARSIEWMVDIPKWQTMANRGEITDQEFNRRVAEALANAC